MNNITAQKKTTEFVAKVPSLPFTRMTSRIQAHRPMNMMQDLINEKYNSTRNIDSQIHKESTKV